jgi:hypothetical protein
MIATGVVSPIFVPLKVTLLVSFLLALPYVLYQAWAFVAPGLYAHEKRIALPIVVSSTVLFLLGVAYCYFVVFGKIFRAIHSYAPTAITPAPDIEAPHSDDHVSRSNHVRDLLAQTCCARGRGDTGETERGASVASSAPRHRGRRRRPTCCRSLAGDTDAFLRNRARRHALPGKPSAESGEGLPAVPGDKE